MVFVASFFLTLVKFLRVHQKLWQFEKKSESFSADNHFILQGHASVRMFEGGLEWLRWHKGMGENCREERKEVSKQPEEEGDEILDKGHSESIMLCAGNGFLEPCYCYDIALILTKMNLFVS